MLLRDGVRLFIIGYSFSDAHINKIIVKAIKNKGLKLYVISPEDPEKLKNRLLSNSLNKNASENDKHGRYIWNAIVNYFPYALREIFPSDQSETDKKKDLFRSVREGYSN